MAFGQVMLDKVWESGYIWKAVGLAGDTVKKEQFSLWKQLGILSTMGIALVAATAIGLAIGYYLDKWLNTSPWLTMLFLLFGIAAGFLNIFRDIARLKDINKEG